jgi:hypothetical protein
MRRSFFSTALPFVLSRYEEDRVWSGIPAGVFGLLQLRLNTDDPLFIGGGDPQIGNVHASIATTTRNYHGKGWGMIGRNTQRNKG